MKVSEHIVAVGRERNIFIGHLYQIWMTARAEERRSAADMTRLSAVGITGKASSPPRLF